MSPLRISLFGLILCFTGGTLYFYYISRVQVSYQYGSDQNILLSEASNETEDKENIRKSSRNIQWKPRERLAVIAYLPKGMSQAYHFMVMLYGSWRYIIDHQEEFFHNEMDDINDIDLLAFCHPSICKEIHTLCSGIKDLNEITTNTRTSKCWAVEQPFEIDIPYGPLNSFIMFNRTDITELIPKYEYLLRTDNDVFITPALYILKPKLFLHGHGGYSDPFNKKRLKEIAGRLGMTHHGRHSIGSTWCGNTSFFLKAGMKTLEITRYLFLNEFDPEAKGLETIDFKKNREGEWIRWWRPVSLLYGGEISLNHLIANFSDENIGKFDSSSCDEISIWKTPHIHCWHNDCEFQKFKFMKYLKIAINSRGVLEGNIMHRIMKNIYPHDVKNMTLKEYSTYIAWSSVSKYLRKYFV